MRNLQPVDLEYFVEICNLGSLAQAGISLGVSQPALSKAVRRLEEAVGSTLLDRKASGVVPTEIGLELRRRAYVVLSELHTTQSVLREMSGARAGTVSIGVAPTLGHQFIPDITRLALQSRPKLHFRIADGLYHELLPRLLQGELDFIVSSPPSAEFVSPDLQYESLGGNSFVACVATDHAFAASAPQQDKELLAHPWVLVPAGGVLRRTLDALFKARGLPLLEPQIETSSPALSKALIVQQRFIGFLPVEVIADDERAGSIRRLDVPWLNWRRELFLLSRRWHSFSPAAQFVVDLVKREAALRFAADPAVTES